MKFVVVEESIDMKPTEEIVIYLFKDSWNDWWKYKTLFSLSISKGGSIEWIGSVKIAHKKMKFEEKVISVDLPDNFEILPDGYFSLGQDSDYYKRLADFSDDIRGFVLNSLQDIAYKPNLFREYRSYDVMGESLMRSISISSVIGQFRRLARGQSKLTKYKFSYISPKPELNDDEIELYEDFSLDIEVEPNSNPPTNTHVVVGRNGVGKTNLMKNLATALLTNNCGRLTTETDDSQDIFANLVIVNFSGFDNTEFFHQDLVKENPLIKYYEIGLMKNVKVKVVYEENEEEVIFLLNSKKSVKDLDYEEMRMAKTVDDMLIDFKNSLIILSKSGKSSRWKRMIRILNSDPIFKAIGIEYLIEREYYNIIDKIFKSLSSGHMYILLTITKLVEFLEEKSILILDEPEMHLHPPLLASFLKAVSELLVNRNAVAIVATHSPVVLQEVPSSCVNILNRNGKFSKIKKSVIETYGENLGTLTREVFGLEVNDSGYNLELKKAVNDFDDYHQVVDYFNNQLASEARTIVKSLLLSKRKEKE